MSDGASPPAALPAPSGGAEWGRQLDRSRSWGLRWVSRAVLATVGVGAVTAILVVVQRRELLAAWTSGQPPDSAIEPLSFAPVAVVLYVVFAGLVLLMLAFLLGAHGWARYCLAASVAFVVLATLAGLRTHPPAAFVAVSVVGVVVEVLTLVLLWHPDVSAHLRADASTPTDRSRSAR